MEDGTFPESIVAILGDARFNHWDGIEVASFDPQGKTLATWGRDLRAQLWEYPSGKLLKRWHALALAASGDGKRLAYCLPDARIYLWDRAESKVVATVPITLPANADNLPRLALDRTGATVAVGFREGTKVYRFGEPAKVVLDVRDWLVDIAPDGLTVVTNKDNTYSLRDVLGGGVIHTLEEPGPAHARFSPDGKTVAIGAHAAVAVWDPANGKRRERLKLGGRWFYPVVFSADSKRLAAGTQSQRISIFDVDSLQEIKEQRVTPTFPSWDSVPRAFTPDGKKLLYTMSAPTNNGILWTHDFNAKQSIAAESWVSAGLAEKGSLLALAGANFDLSTWKPGSGAEPERLANGQTGRLFVSPHGRYVFSSGVGILRGWDAALRSELTGEFWDKSRGGWHVVSKDGRFIALHRGASLEIWDWAARRLVQTITEADESFDNAEFSPDATLLVTFSNKPKNVRLWNIATGRPTGELDASGEWVERMRFTPDGKYVLTAHAYNYKGVHVLEIGSGKERIAHRGSAKTIDVSPDGKTLAQAQPGGIRFIDLLTGLPTRADLRLDGPRGWIRELYYTPDGRHLITVNGDGTVYVVRLSPVSSPVRR